MGKLDLSVVIPAYNEAARLPVTLEEIRPYLDGRKCAYEVLVVDDGSRDNTVALCRRIAENWVQVKIMQQPHRGKGAVVRAGALAAKGDLVLIMDADHPTPIETLDEMHPMLEDHDIVVGVRAFCGEEGSSGRMRRIVGLVQQLLAHVIVYSKSVADSQCGFKLFTQKAAQIVFSRSRVQGGMYDVEIFRIAQTLNLPVFSQPVKWVNKEGSTINILRCMVTDPFSLFYIKLLDLLGKYR